MPEKLTANYVNALEPRDQAYEVYDAEVRGLLVRVETTGAKCYYVRVRRPNGKRNRVKVGATSVVKNPKAARDKARLILAEALAGGDPVAERKATKTLTLREFLDERYEPSITKTHKDGAHSVARIRSSFKGFLDKQLSELNGWLIASWKAKRHKAGTKPATTNRDVATLRAALSYAVTWGLITENPLAGFKLDREEGSKRVRYLSDEEDDRLMQALATREERLRAERDSANQWRAERGYELFPDLRKVRFADHLLPMVLVSLSTGLRRGELFTMTWADVSFQNRYITVRAETAKSRKTRRVPLGEDTIGVLRDWQAQTDGSGLVFKGKGGKPFDNVNKAWKAVLAEAVIENFTWHDMRHTFASRLAMLGEPLAVIKELLGHSSIVMTERYAHLGQNSLASAVERLSNRSKYVVSFDASEGNAR